MGSGHTLTRFLQILTLDHRLPSLQAPIVVDMDVHMKQPDQDALNAYWQQACIGLGIDPAISFDHFHFGDSADLANSLADEVSHGAKRATAGLVAEMDADGEQRTKAGDYWIVVDGAGEPRLVIQSREVRIASFRTVDEAFAWDEGEGDRSLIWWRDAHLEYFRRSCRRIGIAWSEDLDVLFERFDVLWPRQVAERLIVRRPCMDREWAAYHHLRRTALFERYLPEVPYDPEFPENWSPDVAHLGVFSAGELLGCLQIKWISRAEASFHLVAVKEGQRGRGIGRQMLFDSEAFARSNGRRLLRVFAEPESVGFYRSLGFEDGPDWEVVPMSPAAIPLKKVLQVGDG